MTQEWRTRETDPLKRIVAELGELRGTLTSITNGILTNAGLVVAKGLLRVIQSMRVEGNLDVTGTLTTSGDTTLGGNVDVTGDLDVSGTTELGGPTTISGNTDVTGTFGVTGNVQIHDGGRIAVKYPESLGGANAVYFGRTVGEITGNYLGSGLLVERPNGQDMMFVRTNPDGTRHQFQLRDNEDNTVVFVSTDQDRGLSRPTFTFNAPPSTRSNWDSTSSSSFVRIAEGYTQVWHNAIWVVARGVVDDGATAGEMRLMIYVPSTGAEHQLGSTRVLSTASSAPYLYFEGVVPADIGDSIYIRLEARVTAGSGNAYGVVVGANMRP